MLDFWVPVAMVMSIGAPFIIRSIRTAVGILRAEGFGGLAVAVA
jgi:hypothetical protein